MVDGGQWKRMQNNVLYLFVIYILNILFQSIFYIIYISYRHFVRQKATVKISNQLLGSYFVGFAFSFHLGGPSWIVFWFTGRVAAGENAPRTLHVSWTVAMQRPTGRNAVRKAGLRCVMPRRLGWSNGGSTRSWKLFIGRLPPGISMTTRMVVMYLFEKGVEDLYSPSLSLLLGNILRYGTPNLYFLI